VPIFIGWPYPIGGHFRGMIISKGDQFQELDVLRGGCLRGVVV